MAVTSGHGGKRHLTLVLEQQSVRVVMQQRLQRQTVTRSRCPVRRRLTRRVASDGGPPGRGGRACRLGTQLVDHLHLPPPAPSAASGALAAAACTAARRRGGLAVVTSPVVEARWSGEAPEGGCEIVCSSSRGHAAIAARIAAASPSVAADSTACC